MRRGSVSQAVDYCSKNDSSIGEPYSYGTVTAQGQRNDLKRVVEDLFDNDRTDRELFEHYPETYAKYPRFVEKARRIGREARIQVEGYTPRPGWQTDLDEILNGEVHRRKVYWYCDETGNTGKTLFANSFRRRGRRGYRITGGDHASIKHAYGYEEVVFFDWPRSDEERFPYKLLEQFKDGYFLSTKYESHACDFQPPHVVVFANFMPQENQLSADRWQIKII